MVDFYIRRAQSIALSPNNVIRRLNDDDINIFMTADELMAHINNMNLKYPNENYDKTTKNNPDNR